MHRWLTTDPLDTYTVLGEIAQYSVKFFLCHDCRVGGIRVIEDIFIRPVLACGSTTAPRAGKIAEVGWRQFHMEWHDLVIASGQHKIDPVFPEDPLTQVLSGSLVLFLAPVAAYPIR